MSNFFGILSKDLEIDIKCIHSEMIAYENIIISPHNGYLLSEASSDKFPEDNFMKEDNDILIIISGVILNSCQLKNQYDVADLFHVIKKLYNECEIKLCRELRGEFSGLIYDKTKDLWLIFTDQTATKPVFYYQNQRIFIFATTLPKLINILKNLNYHYSLDILGSYYLLTFGFMLENRTLIEDIKKLNPGHIIKFTKNFFSIDSYHQFTNTKQVNLSKFEIIDKLDYLFKAAIKLEYDKDKEYNLRHLVTLSGGLDARMNVFTAHELGYTEQLNITFSQSKYWDAIIAQQMAEDLHHEFRFFALDGGDYLATTLEQAVALNGGLILYSGAAHALSIYLKMDFNPFGLLHTGQLGDAVLGSYLSKPLHTCPKINSGAYSYYLLPKISSQLTRILDNYETEEIFKLYNRGFNGIVNGYWMADPFTQATSPFMNVDFMEYALSIPAALKYKEKIYRDWIILKHPQAASYKWEKTRAKITTPGFIVLGKKIYRKIYEQLFGPTPHYSMNPFDYWYLNNAELQQYINDYMRKNISLLNDYQELQDDAQVLFSRGKLIEKTQVLTLLAFVKQYFQ